ncbi:MAG: hypothetical protein MZV70_76940 [Desulfobacterales bacterium]|nr:hypothetical protein [Desulfobacterales bacterium]
MTNRPQFINKMLDSFLSPKSLSVIIFILTLLVLTGLLSSRYYSFQNIVENGKSKKDIIASKTVEVVDTEKQTEKKRMGGKD